MTDDHDYGIYGPICKRCKERLSAHSVYLENPPPGLEPGDFPHQIAGVYCPLK